jgi:hypothetical protein
MLFAKGVAYFAEYGAELTLLIVAIPKANWIKNIAEDARHGLQMYFAINSIGAMITKELANPMLSINTIAMILLKPRK